MPTRRTACAMAALTIAATLGTGVAAPPPSVLQLADFLTLPITGSPAGTGNNGSLARVNFLREEPGGRRLFVSDLNGPLYIVDKSTKQIATYLDFNGAGERVGLFRRFTFAVGFAGGLITFQFDPDYAATGRFYTVHMEDVSIDAPKEPKAGSAPGLNAGGYTPTPAISTPGQVDREVVLIEWTDTSIRNTSFEGTAREVLRLQLNTRIHPMGDMIFNPSARRGDAEWRVMYLSCGDGGSGEQRTAARANPQRLDTLVGKILRIVPDPAEHTASSTISENGRYRIPRGNPFTGIDGARGEIWAYGLRNPHRLTWDDGRLFASTIGLHAWETVHLIRKGENHGYPLREGHQAMTDLNAMVPIPEDDVLPVRVSDTRTDGTIRPTYPVIEYPHQRGGGDAISGGFVYRGKKLPALRGKFVFGDISTGNVWFADVKEMVAAGERKPSKPAPMQPLRIEWRGATHDSMWGVVLTAYRERGGQDADLPGGSTVSGPGRVDMRFAVDADGELYVLSKSDGMIRAVVGVR